MRAALETPGRELLPDLNAAFVLENDRPEWSFLKGERLFAGSASEGSVVAQFGQFRVRNPTDSGMLSVVDYIVGIDQGGAGRFEIRLGATIGAQAAGSVSPRDIRWGIAAGRIATVLESETAPAVTGTVLFRVPSPAADEPAVFPFAMVLGPGDFFVVTNVIANRVTQVSIAGYERALETYEQ